MSELAERGTKLAQKVFDTLGLSRQSAQSDPVRHPDFLER
jgi:hypothetical protein